MPLSVGWNRTAHAHDLDCGNVACGLQYFVFVEQTKVYRDWINALKDPIGRARIQVRVDRLIHGNPGDHRLLTHGVAELRIDVGPGYRVYYMQKGDRLLLLLVGGDKSSQQKDIAKAIALATAFQE